MNDAALLSESAKASIRNHLGYRNMGADDSINVLYPQYRLGLETLEWNMAHLTAVEHEIVLETLKRIDNAFDRYVCSFGKVVTMSVGPLTRNPDAPEILHNFYLELCANLADFWGMPVGPYFNSRRSVSATHRIL